LPSAIEISGLTKDYGGGHGIRGVSLSVAQGEIFGFLGPNVAGKTTTIRTLLGFLLPTAGSARVLGFDIRRDGLEIRRRTGYLPSDSSLYPHLSGREIIALSLASRELRDDQRARDLAQRLEIDLSIRVKRCSKGMRQKIAIVAAMAHDPDLLVLDEPDTGLDPLVQRTLAALIREAAARGKTVFFSSHNLAEVEELCHRVAIIREGCVVAVDQVASLGQKRLKKVHATFSAPPGDLATIPGVRKLTLVDGGLSCEASGDLRPLLAALAAAPLTDLRVEDPSLEEAFLQFYDQKAST
jgi:ABC-2 type transport system ATP-binding protein